MPGKVKSKKQAAFLGAVAGGKARKKSSLSRSMAKEMLSGTKVKKLPRTARPKAKRRK